MRPKTLDTKPVQTLPKNQKIKKVGKSSNMLAPSERSFKLTYLTKKVIHNTNIPPMLRILDFVFPVEEGYDANLEDVHDDSRYRHPVLGSLGRFKRLTGITYSSVLKEFNYGIEEKFPNPQLWKGIQNVPEFLEFLGKLNNKNADLLVLTLQNLINFTAEIHKIISVVDPNDDKTRLRFEFHIKSSKMNWIKRHPYFKIVYRKNIPDGKGNISGIGHNDLLARFVGMKDPRLCNDEEGFEIFKMFVAENWIHFYLLFINFIIDANNREMMIESSQFRLYKVNNDFGKQMETSLVLVKNQYLDGINIVNNIYFVFVEENVS
jgi:hypothetical protein